MVIVELLEYVGLELQGRIAVGLVKPRDDVLDPAQALARRVEQRGAGNRGQVHDRG